MAIAVTINTTARQEAELTKFLAKNGKPGETLEDYIARIGFKGLDGFLDENTRALEEQNINTLVRAYKAQVEATRMQVLALVRCVYDPNTGVVTWLDEPAPIPGPVGR